MEWLQQTFNTVGILLLVASGTLWGISHVFMVLKLKRFDFYARVGGFILWIAIFFVSGIAAGFWAILIVFAFSMVGVALAKLLKGRYRE